MFEYNNSVSAVSSVADKKAGGFMNTLILLFIVVFVSFGSISAQNVPGVANGSVAANSRDDYDNGIRMRSIELERIKTESYRSAAAAKSAKSREINYSQIKKDFELIQKLQNEIVKTYVTGKQINYERIENLASKLNECAARLDGHLLLSADKSAIKFDEKLIALEDVKDLIVVLDKAIGNFVTSPVFKNLKIIETDNAEKTEADLYSILRLSRRLAEKSAIYK